MAVRIGIDTGGTFTDVVRLGPRSMRVDKVPSTPSDPAQAVLHALAAVRTADDEEVDVVHGTTVGLNAALTGSLARTAFVTNRGFEDLIEIGRQDRPDLYDLEPQRAEVPVPRRLRFGVAARLGPDGQRVVGFEDGELEALRHRLARARVQAVAIGLLHATANPRDERAVAEALASLDVPITCSADLSPWPSEFERFSTAILNGGMAPIMARYMERLGREVGPGRLRLMRSSGGILPTEAARREPARTAFSGPAGGVLATEALMGSMGSRAGRWAAAFDMGGTSTDVCLVGPESASTEVPTLAGLPLALPAAPVHTVGCGGGSIAYADAGGALRVGPQSAGADPGPACYGTGDAPTVTDAHMVLGHMGPETLLGGAFAVDVDRSVRAIETLGAKLGLTTEATARGVLEIAEVNMMRALLVITAERSVDPAQVSLVAYGGAGGLHAAGLCRRLGMRDAWVPPCPGAFSAVGLALAGETEEHAEAVLAPWSPKLEREILHRARRSARALETALGKSLRKSQPGARTALDVRLRYRGQGSPLTISGPASPRRQGKNLAQRFADAHRRQFGFDLGQHPIEIVQWIARVSCRPGRLRPADVQRSERPASITRRSPVGRTRWTVHARAALANGVEVDGPCVIEEHTGAIVVPRGTTAQVQSHGIRLRIGAKPTR